MRYRYTPRLLPIFLAMVFFGVCLAFYVKRGLTNDEGLIIDHLIELGPAGATVFYWVLATFSGGFVLLGAAALGLRLLRTSQLVFEEQGLSIPSRWTKRVRLVTYDSVQGIQLLKVHGQSLLQITTTSGKVTVAGIMLQSDAQLQEVAAELTKRVPPPANHGGKAASVADSRAR